MKHNITKVLVALVASHGLFLSLTVKAATVTLGGDDFESATPPVSFAEYAGAGENGWETPASADNSSIQTVEKGESESKALVLDTNDTWVKYAVDSSDVAESTPTTVASNVRFVAGEVFPWENGAEEAASIQTSLCLMGETGATDAQMYVWTWDGTQNAWVELSGVIAADGAWISVSMAMDYAEGTVTYSFDGTPVAPVALAHYVSEDGGAAVAKVSKVGFAGQGTIDDLLVTAETQSAPLPVAYVTEEPETAVAQGLDVAFRFCAYSDADLAIYNKIAAVGGLENIASANLLDEEFARVFELLAAAEPYMDWHADFVVTFNNNIEEGAVQLAGQYSINNSWYDGSWVTIDMPAVKANTPVRLLASVGITESYAEMLTDVVTFRCGALNVAAPEGTTMAVELRLYPATGNGLDAEVGEPIVIASGSREYELTKPLDTKLPVAYVSEEPETAAAQGLDTVYRFCVYSDADLAIYNKIAAVGGFDHIGEAGLSETESARVAELLAAAEPFLDWHADFVVTFDHDISAGAVQLAGQYNINNKWYDGSWVTVDMPAVKAGTPFRLLGSAGITESYAEMLTDVVTFLCGAHNISAPAGTKMTVELRLYPATGNGLDAEAGKSFAIASGTVEYDLPRGNGVVVGDVSITGPLVFTSMVLDEAAGTMTLDFSADVVIFGEVDFTKGGVEGLYLVAEYELGGDRVCLPVTLTAVDEKAYTGTVVLDTSVLPAGTTAIFARGFADEAVAP